jgi:hypothetical protein
MLTLLSLGAACALVTSADAPATVLSRARHVLGLDAASVPVIRMTTRDAISHAFESDRMYPPYLTFVEDHVAWVDPSTGVERDSMTGMFGQRAVMLSDDHGVSGSFTSWAYTEGTRALDPRLVVHAWSSASDVRTLGRCSYRDYPRIVLERAGLYGPERLFVDPKTGFVVKLDRIEPHYLWGDVHVEYVYTTWLLYGAASPGHGFLMPTTAVRVVNGENEVTRSLVRFTPVATDSAPALTMPDSGRVSTVPVLPFLRPAPLDTMRLGPSTFLLVNPGYNEIVSLIHDTIYVLDATQGEARARADSAWIGRLFPGRFPVAVVVTDLAWPHVSGVRFWVASGATVMSRDMSRAFLDSVVTYHWRLHPDKLESVHPRPKLLFRAVGTPAKGRDIGFYPIDGIASEGALMVYLPRDSVLWGSDYVQTLDAPTLYAAEVYAAACRYGLTPSRIVAQHQQLADWSAFTAVVQRLAIADYPVSCNRP